MCMCVYHCGIVTLATAKTLAEICDNREVVTVQLGEECPRSCFTTCSIDMNHKFTGNSGKCRAGASVSNCFTRVKSSVVLGTPTFRLSRLHLQMAFLLNARPKVTYIFSKDGLEAHKGGVCVEDRIRGYRQSPVTQCQP